MVLNGTDMTWMVRPVLDRRFEDDALVVAFALTLRLDAVGASRTFFTALDASFPTGKTSRLGSLSHLGA